MTRPAESATFHAGEQALQARVGVAERMAEVGHHFIRPAMSDEHRELFAELPFVWIGSVDAAGAPWASLLVGAPGFIESPDARRLHVRGHCLHGDPLRSHLIVGAPLGLLGIQLETRRRNRANGFVVEHDAEGFLFEVAQSYGNCPKYIQARSPQFVADPASFATERALRIESSVLSADAIAQIERSDTFFIASATRNEQGGYDRVHGVDVSHRGGKPGFVRATLERGASVLSWPDFAGNNLFNTLGNLTRDPRAGLLFVDFESGDLTALTGRAEVLWTGAELGAFRGAQRLVRFNVERGYAAPGAVPLRASAPVPARQLAATGSWAEVRTRTR